MTTDNVLPFEERRAKYAVPALEKALDVLEFLAEQAVPMTQAELARALQRQPGEIFRMLACLESRGYLRRHAETGGYSLTLKLYELSRTHSPFEELLAVANPSMQVLADTLRESCHLSVIHRDRVLVLAQAESPEPFRLSVKVGSLHTPLKTTSGRLLLAYMTDTERKKALSQQSEWRAMKSSDRTALLKRLAAIRARGHERANGERFVGGLDVGVLVGTRWSSLKAALTVATLKSRKGPDLDVMLPHLRDCAAAIGTQAGLLNDGPRP